MTAVHTDKKGYVPSEEQVANLASMGLPADYLALGAKSRRNARLRSLRAWFDPDPARAYILCTDLEAFIRAHRLWVEFYIKPDPHNAGVYHFADPEHKYDMVRMAMAESRTQNQPAKSACVAPRRSTKTITLIQEMCSLIVTARTTPVSILISEMNADRTSEEIINLRLQFENNELIHADFGGGGVLFPKGRTTGERWNDSRLQFVHNKSLIMGYSVASKQRGRHPTLGIIDDPEDEDLSRNPEWRRKYFRWLFKTYMPMFGPGGKIMWIGTLIHEFSCLQLAMLGNKETQEEDDEVEVERDERFDDWNRRVFRMIEEDPDTGEETSIFPEYMSVEDFQRYKKTYGLSAAMSEFQGISVGAGHFVFHRESFKHGYMRCMGAGEGDEDYMLDLRTGQRMGWRLFVESLHVVGAGDMSDSIATTADPGALVFVGRNAAGTIYVLDTYIRRCHADHLVKKGYELGPLWGAEKIGWEQCAMQSAVVRYAAHYGEQLRRAGKLVPLCRGVNNTGKDKIRRIMAALVPLIGDYEVRFLYNEEVVDANGVTHHPRPCGNARYHRILKEQVDGFTDEGSSGHDDGIDALEMAIRVLGKARGIAVADDGDDPEKSLALWADVGMVWPKNMIPRECWTKEMWEEAQSTEAVTVDSEMDPYE